MNYLKSSLTMLIFALSFNLLISSNVNADDVIETKSMNEQYREIYDFISIPDTAYNFYTEFKLPKDYHYLNPADLSSYQNWITDFPLWHRHKSLGNWKGAKVFDRDSVSRGIHIPWVGRNYVDHSFPIRILSEYYRFKNIEYSFSFQPNNGKLLTYANYLKGTIAKTARGEVIIKPGDTREPSDAEFYKLVHYIMNFNNYKLIAENCDEIKPEEVLPGDLFLSFSDNGREGLTYLIMNIIENKKGQRQYAIGSGCKDPCDFHIPKVNVNRHNPWISSEQIKAFRPLSTKSGFYRFKVLSEIDN